MQDYISIFLYSILIEGVSKSSLHGAVTRAKLARKGSVVGGLNERMCTLDGVFIISRLKFSRTFHLQNWVDDINDSCQE